ncbi:hypothetical protein ZIOFF_009419 [Zingiber officinale]|uniref:Uncharacterized protein n=1 Tax=Zingiber officinale TaxID=94328 RepID=A0A8J5I3N7_ZINOF|nr:hypothetical protein ZIOFF_009419 [Zingiber officinale]
MEEFSFPAIAVDQTYSSPLWFQLPPKATGGLRRRRSLTMATEEDHKTGVATGTDHEYEERMGMLWEDFNEELHRLSHEQVSQGRCCMAVVDRRRTSTRLVSILKAMLKRLLMLHRDRSSSTGSCYRISLSD